MKYIRSLAVAAATTLMPNTANELPWDHEHVDSPWHLTVGRLGYVTRDHRGDDFCNGVLVSPTLILTAEHCVDNALSNRQIRFRTLDQQIDRYFSIDVNNPTPEIVGQGIQSSNPAHIERYEWIANDRAFIQLEEPVKRTEYVSIASPQDIDWQDVRIGDTGFETVSVELYSYYPETSRVVYSQRAKECALY